MATTTSRVIFTCMQRSCQHASIDGLVHSWGFLRLHDACAVMHGSMYMHCTGALALRERGKNELRHSVVSLLHQTHMATVQEANTGCELQKSPKSLWRASTTGVRTQSNYTCLLKPYTTCKCCLTLQQREDLQHIAATHATAILGD